jgi:hypothetical protein
VWLGYPLATPLIGLLITVAFFRVVWESGKAVFTRPLEEVNPELMDAIKNTATHIQGFATTQKYGSDRRATGCMQNSMSPRMRYFLCRKGMKERKRAAASFYIRGVLSDATIHIDPSNASDEAHHPLGEHGHDTLFAHSHEEEISQDENSEPFNALVRRTQQKPRG